MNRRFLIALMAIGLSFFSLDSFAQSIEQTLKLSLEPVDQHVVFHEPVMALLTIENPSDQSAEINLGTDRATAIQVNAILPNRSSSRVKLQPRGGLSLVGTVEIAPHSHYSQLLFLDDWINFSQLGTYEISVILDNPIKTEDGVLTQVKSGEIARTVESSDAQKLSKFCMQQLMTLLSSQSSSEAIEASRILSRVHDPVAIPFLAQAFQTSFPVYDLLASGFVEIGTDDAAKALLEVLKVSPASKIQESKGALEKIESKTTDPTIQLQIRKIIEANPQ